MDKILTMQSLNFEHLRDNWPELADLGGWAEKYIFEDPQSAILKLRCFAELLVDIIYTELELPCEYNSQFISRLQNDAFLSVIDRGIIDKLHLIRKQGNQAAHNSDYKSVDDLHLLKEAHILGSWLLLVLRKGTKDDLTAFIEPSNSMTDGIELIDNQRRLDQVIAELEATKNKVLLAQQETANLKRQLDESMIVDIQERNSEIKNQLQFNEDQTRRWLIDTQLHSRGWDIDLRNETNTESVRREVEVDNQPTETGQGFCDYVLYDDNGQPLAVIEAKRTRENPEKGRQQAKLYADALENSYQQRPIIFYTNGYDIYLWDDYQQTPPRRLYSFYSKDSLQYLIRQRDTKRELLSTQIDTSIAGRDYQIESITRVCERFDQKHRKALLVQATGTGKTRVAIALTKRLINSGWAKRILFLCDRRELRKQASNAYAEFLNEPIYIVGKSNKDDRSIAQIFIATYPGMMRIYEEFDPGYFDLIIADESHRSIYNVYGDLFKYFDSYQLGLTATPVEMISRSTSQLFGCEYKMPTANYPLEKAVEEKYLVPFKVVNFTTKFLRDGIQGASLSDEQTAELEESGIDPNTLDFDAKSIDKTIYNKDTNRAILRNLMEAGQRLADEQTLGKSIIFARNIEHADLLAKLFSELYPGYGGNFCRVIHSKYERSEELIDDFKSNSGKNSEITIAISVDMLDTGIDIPEVLNLVFAKPIRSKVKFWQMIGRGTRPCKNIFGPKVDGSHDKGHFLVFDHWDNFGYFELNPDRDSSRRPKSLSQKLFESRLILAETALKKVKLDVFEEMILLIKQDIDCLDDNTIAIKDNWVLKQTLSQIELLHQFSPKTKESLFNEMAPLMQWRNISHQSEALKFDLDMVIAQYRVLTKSPLLNESKSIIQNKLGSLSMHLNQVRKKAESIKVLAKDDFWTKATFNKLEYYRKDLRDIIRLRDRENSADEAAVIIDIKEDEAAFEWTERPTNMRNVDYEIFRQEVEKTLTPLFNQNAVLKKIRAGDPVTQQELVSLNALMHTKNPNLDLSLLSQFFPDSSAGVDELLRTIVGLDVVAIEKKFNKFIQKNHVTLSSMQQRFLALLKSEICRRGQITVAELYEQPFTSLHTDGVDGLFKNEQAELIAGFVAGFTVDMKEHISKLTLPQIQV